MKGKSEVETPLTQNIDPDRGPLDLDGYERSGGYAALRRGLKEMTPGEVVEEVSDARLRGRGGAGFPTGVKWGFMPSTDEVPQPRYLLCNADEMEPGTFKDRFLMEGDPHQLIEAMLLSAYALQTAVGYIFLRRAYAPARKALDRAIAEAREAGYIGRNILGSGFDCELHLHVSAGRYMAGEETGLINAMEGGRAVPRHKPPYPPQSGLWGRPSNVNNVETLCSVPHIIARGAEWYVGLSRSDDGGTKLYGASGKVRRPGIYELPLGTTMGEVLHEHAGGMRNGAGFRGLLPGGASTGFLTDEHLDVPLDFEKTEEAGSRLGTGTLVVLDDRSCPVGMLHNLEKFFARESCGWCTPCREGLPWTRDILAALEAGEGRPGDLDTLRDHCRFLGMGFTFCALAPGAVMPLQTGLKYFADDFERHIRDGRCPYRGPSAA
jgi:NADH-quinone oxidoreductase subunit F